MEAVTTGTIRRAMFLSNRYHQQTNTQIFYRPDGLPVAQPTVLLTQFRLMQRQLAIPRSVDVRVHSETGLEQMPETWIS